MTPKGWTRLNEANLPLVINQERTLAIAVSTGSKDTGIKEGYPYTSSAKGPMTAGVVLMNQQRELFSEIEMLRTGEVIKLDEQRQLFSQAEMLSEPSSQTMNIKRVTWILLMYRDAEELRCELSCPIGMTEDGYVDGWKERIILPVTRFDGLDPSKITEPLGPNSPEIIVEIKKRA